MTIDQQIEEAKNEYSPVLRISNEVFTKRASEILSIPIERIQVRRSVGDNWGKLSVYVFNQVESQQYYCLKDGEYCFKNLSSNIDGFSRALAEKKI